MIFSIFLKYNKKCKKKKREKVFEIVIDHTHKILSFWIKESTELLFFCKKLLKMSLFISILAHDNHVWLDRLKLHLRYWFT